MSEIKSLSELFNNSLFRIPDYQRGYSWGNKQCEDFWDDLINLLPKKKHYTGVLSLNELDAEKTKNLRDERWLLENNYKVYEIVDGQQRLTTFLILLCSILEYAESNDIGYLNGEDIESIKRKYIVNVQLPQRICKAFIFGYEKYEDPSYKYLRTKIFRVEKDNDLEENLYTMNLEKAKEFFDKKVKDFPSKKGNSVADLYKKLVNFMVFNVYEISDDFDVNVAFETMNNRGKSLSNLEILKNRLIYLTTIFPSIDDAEREKLRKDINLAWKEIYKQIARNKEYPLNDDDFLRNHWYLYFMYSRKRGDDYAKFLLEREFTVKSIINGFDATYIDDNVIEDSSDDADIEEEQIQYTSCKDKNNRLTPKDIMDYINSLKETIPYWFIIQNPNFDDKKLLTDNERNWLLKLNRIGFGYFKALATAALMDNKSTDDEKEKLLETIEHFIFVIFRMGEKASNYFSSEIYRKARDLFRGNTTVSKITSEINEKLNDNKNNSVAAFKIRMSEYFKDNQGYYSWGSKFYFFFEYEAHLVKKTNVTKLDYWNKFIKSEKDYISIEHILPQTPDGEYWLKNFGKYINNGKSKFLTNSLGNLLALSQSVNSSLQNDCFDIKKNGRKSDDPDKFRRGYRNGSQSEIEVGDYSDWTPEAIKERGLLLLQWMEKRWNVDLGDENEKLKLLGLDFMINNGNKE